MTQAYPLQWPDGWPRNTGERAWGPFRVSLAVARDDMLRQLAGLGATSVVISTNVPTRNDGLPYSRARTPGDAGVAVYWTLGGQPMCAARDAFSRVEANLRSIGKVVEAMRTIERNGGDVLLDRTFRGFHALPPGSATADAEAQPARPWREVFGFPDDYTPSLAICKAAFRELVQKAHPDRGGNADQMRELTTAREHMTKELETR